MLYWLTARSNARLKLRPSQPRKSEQMKELVMTPTYDPNAWFDVCRSAFAPVIRTQEEYFKAMDRIARVQYAAAGDVLESSLAQAHAALEAKSPGDYLAKSTELSAKLGDKLRSRTNELVSATAEVQTSVTRMAGEVASKAGESAKKAA
jgi:phasin family protein